MCSTGRMRWDGQRVPADGLPAGPAQGCAAEGVLPGLEMARAGWLRTVSTPEFAGIRFHEVAARSALNQVPAASRMPFRWTINPFRGCAHACVYCFARGTHSYLELDTGTGFDREIVVKVNLVDVLRAELRRPGWRREHVALGTNTDPYQRAEGRYRLMPGVITSLAGSGTPFSILTKGTLLRRDLPLLARVARDVPVGLAMSIAIWDDDLHRSLEPGVPTARGRLETVAAARELGLPCGVLMAPVLPHLTDSVEDLDRGLGQLAAAGATGASVFALHLRPGAREWFLSWLASERPGLLPRYRRLYGRGSYVSAEYSTWLAERVAPLLHRHGLAGPAPRQRRVPGDEEAGFPAGSMPPVAQRPGGGTEQLALL